MTIAAGKTPFHSFFPGSAMSPEGLPWEFFDSADLTVQDSDGTTLAEGTDYSVSGDSAAGAASITPLVAVDPAIEWYVWSDTPGQQQLDLTSGKAVDVEQYETELDRRTMIERELKREIGRRPRFPRGAVTIDFADLEGIGDGDLLEYRGGVLTKFDATPFAGKFYAGMAVSGRFVPATGLGADAGLREDLAANTGASLVKGPDDLALDKHLQALAVPIEKFVGADYDYLTEDAAAGFEAAWSWSATNRPVVLTKDYLLLRAAEFTDAGGCFIFDDCTIHLDSAIPEVNLHATLAGPLGLVFNGADDCILLGSGSVVGKNTVTASGVAGSTQLGGVAFHECQRAKVFATMHFEALAAGRFAYFCDKSYFHDITGYNIGGNQTFGGAGNTATGGDLDVSAGCTGTRFGGVDGVDVFKAGRYQSFATRSDATTPSNVRCNYGPVIIEGRAGSQESSGLAVRGAKFCNNGSVRVTQCSKGVYVTSYAGDPVDAIAENDYAGVSGDGHVSGAAADSLFEVNQGGGAPAIGINRIAAITGAGGTNGILLTGGTTFVGTAEIDAPYPVYAQAQAALHFGYIGCAGQLTHAMIGDDTSIWGDHFDIKSGASNGAGYQGITNNDLADTLRGHIRKVTYNQNGIGSPVNILFYDAYGSPAGFKIDDFDGVGAAGYPARWQSYFPASIKAGVHYAAGAAAPTSATHETGALVVNSTPAVGGPWARVCQAGGTPGTWEPLSVVGMVQAAAYTAPAGGATVDAECRAALADMAAKLAAAGVTA